MSHASVAKIEYSPLPLAGIIPDMIPQVDLYLPTARGQKPLLYRERNAAVDEKGLQSLRSRGIVELWVTGDDQAAIATFLAEHLGNILDNEAHAPQERMKVLNQVVTNTLRDSMDCHDPTASVIATQTLAQHLADFGQRSDVKIRDVARVAQHDFCTFTHSANVACYCTLLAKSLGISNEIELKDIATAGMLHDMGKLEIPLAILNKPARLTKEEFDVVKLHPTRGLQQLRNEFTLPQLLLVYQHHEKLDGTGYPVGCVGDEIHPWARMCAVVDVYEALTGKRPYRRPNTAAEAMTILRRGAGTHFDPEMLSCWQSNFVRENDA